MTDEPNLITDTFFRDLDREFQVNLRHTDAEPYVYRTTDLLVHQTFELPIPMTAGAVVKYKFTTEIGDISFSTKFYMLGTAADTIIEPSRVPSNVQPIVGSFKASHDGTFIMYFDNTFSWFNPKLLSYIVELHQVLIHESIVDE